MSTIDDIRKKVDDLTYKAFDAGYKAGYEHGMTYNKLVYILIYYNYDECEIYGVYTSKELAESKIPEAIEVLNLDEEEYDFKVNAMEVEDV